MIKSAILSNHVDGRLLMKNFKSIWCCETVKLCLLYTAKDPRLRNQNNFIRSRSGTNIEWTNNPNFI